VRVKIDSKTGCVTSLFDKRSGSETLGRPPETDAGGPKDSVCGNLLQAFTDKPKEWAAWNIDSDFEKETLGFDHARRGQALWSTDRCAELFASRKHFQNSTFRAGHHSHGRAAPGLT